MGERVGGYSDFESRPEREPSRGEYGIPSATAMDRFNTMTSLAGSLHRGDFRTAESQLDARQQLVDLAIGVLLAPSEEVREVNTTLITMREQKNKADKRTGMFLSTVFAEVATVLFDSNGQKEAALARLPRTIFPQRQA